MDEYEARSKELDARFLQVLKDASDLYFTNTEMRMAQNSDECMADALGMLVAHMMGWGIEPTELFLLYALYSGCQDANAHRVAGLYEQFYHARTADLKLPLSHYALKEAAYEPVE